MVTYRQADAGDYLKIAKLHVKSWQQNYRGDFSDQFLDTEATAEREGVWQNRLNNPTPNQYCWVAEQKGEIYGFACAFLEDDAKYGALLDNLHVLDTAKGKGIGRYLMRLVAQEVLKNDSGGKLYLWVLKNNASAMAFYERLGGINCETIAGNDIGDQEVLKCRIIWDNLKELAH
ncbi:MAG: GNAT family N-acetyltransferase [Arenibacter sp.]